MAEPGVVCGSEELCAAACVVLSGWSDHRQGCWWLLCGIGSCWPASVVPVAVGQLQSRLLDVGTAVVIQHSPLSCCSKGWGCLAEVQAHSVVAVQLLHLHGCGVGLPGRYCLLHAIFGLLLFPLPMALHGNGQCSYGGQEGVGESPLALFVHFTCFTTV